MSISPEQIRQNVEAVRSRMASAAMRSGRSPDSVRLVAVTKKWPAEAVRPLVGTAEQALGVPGPYTLSVTAPQAIRQVIISGQQIQGRTAFLQGPLLITKVEVNHRRR